MTTYIPFDDLTDEILIQIDSSKADILHFIKSTIHSDFLKACDIEINELTNLLDDPSLEYTGRHYDKFRGAKEAIVRMKQVFHNLYESLEENKTENEKRSEQ